VICVESALSAYTPGVTYLYRASEVCFGGSTSTELKYRSHWTVIEELLLRNSQSPSAGTIALCTIAGWEN
jgi:hypothetical protein